MKRSQIIEFIRKERRVQNITQEKLGKLMKPPVSKQRVFSIEKGKNKSVTHETLQRMLDALGYEFTVKKKYEIIPPDNQ